MKAVQIIKPNELRVIEMAVPEIDDYNNVLVKMTAAGICGSDIGIYHGTNAAGTYPRILGHEMVGEVAAIGVGAEQFKPGDRVIINQVTSCGRCYPCRLGRGNVCDHLAVRGVHIDGGYREWIAVPATDCYRLPDTISDIDAVMIEPTTIGLQACARAELKREDMLLIYGAGALGSSILKIARLYCDHIIVADIQPEKLESAYQNGASYTINVMKEELNEQIKAYTGGRGVTVSIDAVCNAASLPSLLAVTGNAGRIITMGFSTAATEINQFAITSRELEIRGSRLQNQMFGQAIELIGEGKVTLNGAVSHTFPLTKAQAAFDFLDRGDPAIRKVVLTFDT